MEVFFRARDVGLRVVEVPVDCDYKNYPEASKNDPLKQGFSIVASILGHVIREGI